MVKENCRNSGGKMKYNYQKYGDTKKLEVKESRPCQHASWLRFNREETVNTSIVLSFCCRDDLSYGFNTLGPLCLWQCFILTYTWSPLCFTCLWHLVCMCEIHWFYLIPLYAWPCIAGELHRVARHGRNWRRHQSWGRTNFHKTASHFFFHDIKKLLQ